jgi:hypothetical protein
MIFIELFVHAFEVTQAITNQSINQLVVVLYSYRLLYCLYHQID